MPTTLEITAGDSSAVDRLAAALAEQGMIVTREPSRVSVAPMGAPCAICGEIHARQTMEEHPKLGGAICPICMGEAGRIYRAAQMAANRQMRELVGQLPQMVRDRRAGMEMPTFYQGFE